MTGPCAEAQEPGLVENLHGAIIEMPQRKVETGLWSTSSHHFGLTISMNVRPVSDSP